MKEIKSHIVLTLELIPIFCMSDNCKKLLCFHSGLLNVVSSTDTRQTCASFYEMINYI